MLAPYGTRVHTHTDAVIFCDRHSVDRLLVGYLEGSNVNCLTFYFFIIKEKINKKQKLVGQGSDSGMEAHTLMDDVITGKRHAIAKCQTTLLTLKPY